MLHELLIIVALILANGVLAGAEIAVVSMRSSQAQTLAEERGRAGDALGRLRRNPERFLATVQIGITVVAAAAAAYGGGTFAVHLAPALEPLPFVGAHADAAAMVIAVAIVSYLSLVLGELVPKSLGLRYAARYSLLVARPLLALSTLARPLVWLLTASSNVLLRAFGDRTTFAEARLSPAELQELVDEAGRSGSVHPESTEIASRAIEFAELTVEEVMIPRHDVVAIPRGIDQASLRRAILDDGRSRMPVYDGDLDSVIGYVTLHEILEVLLERGEIHLEAVLRPAHFVPESMRAVELLAEMRARRSDVAIAVDEQGSLAGLVTIEKLLGELVGEYGEWGEHEAPRVRREPDGATLVRGDVAVRDLNRELDLDLPESATFSTIAGLCLDLAERIPEPGAVLALPDGTHLEVVDASPRRVREVRIRPGAGSGDEARPG